MTRRATTLLAMAAAMAATSMLGGLAAMPQPYQRRALRQLEKKEPTAGDLERIAKAGAKRERKNAKRMRPKMNIVFLSGDANPLPGMDAVERRANRRCAPRKGVREMTEQATTNDSSIDSAASALSAGLGAMLRDGMRFVEAKSIGNAPPNYACEG